MQAVTKHPGVVETGRRTTSEPTRDESAFASGAVIGTAIALFPWSLLILLITWLF